MYASVIAALDKPASGVRVAIDPVNRAAGQFDVPFIARPGARGPPVARRAPRPGLSGDPAVDSRGGNETRLHFGRQRRTKSTESQVAQTFLSVRFFLIEKRTGRNACTTTHPKRPRPVRIHQLRRPDIS